MKLVESIATGRRMPEATAREIDEIYKSLPADCHFQTKAIVTDAIQFEPGERSEVSIISTNAVDLDNEVVLPEAIDYKPYQKSRKVLWNHDHNREVAHCLWIKSYKNSIRAKTLYPEDSDNQELTDRAWFMTQGGILKAKSIGFIPRLPKREPTNEELSLHPEWAGAGLWDDIILYEYSCCSAGVNSDAIVEAINTKSLDAAMLAALDIAMPEPRAVAEVLQPWVQKAFADDSVAKKIQWLYDNGEDKKYSKEQIAAIAYAHCAKGKVKKSIDITKLLLAALESVTLDPDKIMREALEQYKNRGRV